MRKFSRAMAVLIGALLAIAAVALPASGASAADEAYLRETTNYNVTVQWDRWRTITKQGSYASYRYDNLYGGSGGSFAIGMRNSSGTQFARTRDMTGPGTWSIFNNSGGLGLSRGTFALNTRIVGSCGGSGCGPQTFEGLFRWNI